MHSKAKQCQCGAMVEDTPHSRYCKKCHTFTASCYTEEYNGKQSQDETVEKEIHISRTEAKEN